MGWYWVVLGGLEDLSCQRRGSLGKLWGVGGFLGLFLIGLL